MAKHNGENERVKRRYLDYLRAAKGFDEVTLDMHAKAVARSEEYTSRRSFKQFHIEQANGFRAQLAKATNRVTGKPLAKASVHQTLNALRSFCLWLAGQPGYKRRIAYADADYFRPNLKDARAVSSRLGRTAPTLEQVKHTLSRMPAETEVQQRDRALLACILLTGARDKAIVTLRLKHVDVLQRRVVQDGREVCTKGAKTIETWFFPVGEEIEKVLLEWIDYLRIEKLFGGDDPVFPATEVVQGSDRRFRSQGVSRKFWSTAEPVRKIFRDAFENAELPYFNPHSIRNTLVQFGERVCRTPEEFKAWSQNLGHEQVSTTFTSYGRVAPYRQGELIRGIGSQPATSVDPLRTTIADEVARQLRMAHDSRQSPSGS